MLWQVIHVHFSVVKFRMDRLSSADSNLRSTEDSNLLFAEESSLLFCKDGRLLFSKDYHFLSTEDSTLLYHFLKLKIYYLQ